MNDNKLLRTFGLGLAMLSLVACGGQGESVSSKEESSPESYEESLESSGPYIDPDLFAVTVLMPDGSPATGVKVQWCNKSACFMPIGVDENGVAVNEDLTNAQYYVHLLSLPEGYTYNPNIYTPNESNKHIEIRLEAIAQMKLENKLDEPGKYNRYMMESDKAYEITLSGDGKFDYLGFNAKEPGIYEIESWAVDNLAVNPTDPVFAYYGGERNFIPSAPYEEVEDGGIGKNFKYTFEMGEDCFRHDGEGNPERNGDGSYIAGVSHTYAISGTATAYPSTFTVKITRVGDYEEPVISVETVEVESNLSKAADPQAGTIFDRGKLLEGEETAYYDEANDVYRLNNESGAIIYARITKSCEFFEKPISKFAEEGSNPFLFNGGTEDYSLFVSTYASFCNVDGTYPVNAELKGFFDKFQANAGYFLPGGWVASQATGYQKGNEWLFACGYYVKAEGSEARPYVIEEEGIATCKVEAGGKAYFKLKLDGCEKALIESTNAYAALTMNNGDVYEKDDHSGFSATIDLEGGYIYFSLSFSDGHAGNIGFTVEGLTAEDIAIGE